MIHNRTLILIVRKETLNVIKRKSLYGKEQMHHAYFEVELSQIRSQMPSIAEKITVENGSVARIFVLHGTHSGMFESREAEDKLRAYQPHAIFCCFPSEARRTYPDLPIFGWHESVVMFSNYENSEVEGDTTVVSIDYNQE